MYDNPNLPYRCPICLNPVSDCLEEANTRKKVCGCMTCNCKAPDFIQGNNDSIYVPRIKWDQWVIAYRKDHPNWHREALCKGCIKEHEKCESYDENSINCSSYDSFLNHESDFDWE